MSLTIIIGLGAVSRRGNEQTNRELFMSFFERGDQHQICGGSSKCSLSIFLVNQRNTSVGERVEGTERRKQEKTLYF